MAIGPVQLIVLGPKLAKAAGGGAAAAEPSLLPPRSFPSVGSQPSMLRLAFAFRL
jgi:hypothetical protein